MDDLSQDDLQQKEREEQDDPWKRILRRLFRPMVQLCFPPLNRLIDWRRGYEFLENEIQKLAIDSQTSKHAVDKLVKVFLKNGEEQWILVHIEVQSSRQGEFPMRMWRYNALLRLQHSKPVVSLAILTDNNPRWRPEQYRDELAGCEIRFRYPVVKVLDYADRHEELETSDNPFASVLMAQLRAIQTRKNANARYEARWDITRRLYERGYNKEQIRDIFAFMDWIMHLPKQLEENFRLRLRNLEEVKKMPYMTYIERKGKEEGRREGRREGRTIGLQQGAVQEARQALINILSARFGRQANSLRPRIKAIQDLQLLRRLQKQAAIAENLTDFEDAIPTP